MGAAYLELDRTTGIPSPTVSVRSWLDDAVDAQRASSHSRRFACGILSASTLRLSELAEKS